MDTNASIVLLLADLNAQVRALQEENAQLRMSLAQEDPDPAV